MKKKTLSRIAVFAFTLCLVSTAVASKTLAAFYAEIEGRGNITVADFTVLTFEKGVTNLTATFDLADTKEDNGLVNPDKIAPGDKGSFDIVLGESDVAYTYALTLGSIQPASEGKILPIKFYSDDEYTILFEDPASDAVVTINAETNKTEKVVHTVYWRWDTEAPGDLDHDIDYESITTHFMVDLSATQEVPAAAAPVEP